MVDSVAVESLCGNCQVSKPRTDQYFRPLESGLSSTCTTCLESKSRKRKANQLTAPRPQSQEVSRCGNCRVSKPRTIQYFKPLQSGLSSTCTACLESKSRKRKANLLGQQSRRSALPGGQGVDIIAPRPQRQEVGTRWNDSQLSQRTKDYQQDQRTRDRDARLRARNGQPPGPMVEDATDEDDMPVYLMSRFQGLNR